MVAPITSATPAELEASASKDKLDYDNDSSDAASLDSHDSVAKTPGVLKMEAVGAVASTPEGKWSLWAVAFAVFVMYFIYCQQNSTTYQYSVWATSSFKEHASGLATMSIATGIVSAVSGPFFAKIADVWSRPWLTVISVISYTVGFVIILKSPTLAAYIVGNVFVTLGSSAMTLMSSVLIADLVPLQWRGMAHGILSSPYIWIPWYSAYIADALSAPGKWRWGYGMYAIIMPFVMIPAGLLLFWLQRRAVRLGAAPKALLEKEKVPFTTALLQAWSELDGFGLILMGFGWSLLLLPFSLSGTAKGGYSNPSLIAMLVVGIFFLLCTVVYEIKWAKYPSVPARLLKNKTFAMAAVIDFIWMLAGYMNLLYLSSYAYIVTDMNNVEWGYWGNTLTVALCVGGVIAGTVQRLTHRYKFLQCFGLFMKIIGYGLLVDKNGVHDIARLVSSQVLTGIGGSFAVVGSQVGSQASVPHQDVGLCIALLSLVSSIGRAVGDAVAFSVWSHHMPQNLRKYLPATVNDTQIAEFYGNIVAIKALPYDDPVRQGCIKAYEQTVYPLWAAALGLSFLALFAACFQTNYFLGNSQNAYDHKGIDGVKVEDGSKDHVKAKGWRRVLRFWDL